MDEESLIIALKSRDEDAFIKMVNSYKNKILALCYSFTQDRFEAEDLSQEVFISIYNSIGKFRGNSTLSTYIYKITISRCVDYNRKKSIKAFITGIQKEHHYGSEDLEDRNYIRDIIKSLPKEVRTVVVLYYYMGLEHKEIADIVNSTAKAVEGKLYRARNRIRKELEKEGFGVCSKDGII
jgi:RNA polymerase sigma factor (sigma-70 family)